MGPKVWRLGARRTQTVLLAAAANAVFAGLAAAQTAPVSENQPTDIDEVVVTAQRREERLRDVPIAITALSPQQLISAGVSGSLGLAAITPGLNYNVLGVSAQPTIRGIGSSVTTPGNDPNVALYIDGVYMPTQAANIFDLDNILRIEVLKGPQGTLFGRNATGGALNITTLTPSQTPMGRLGLTYGSFKEVKVTGYGTAGLTDTLAADVAVLYHEDDGYARDVLSGARLATYEEFSIRSKLLWTPTENATVTLAADYADKEDITGYTSKILPGTSSIPGSFTPPGDRDFALSFVPRSPVEAWGVSLSGRYDFSNYTLSGISSYRNSEVTFLNDQDRTAEPGGLGVSYGQRQATATHEVNVASDFQGRFNWIGGVFYYHDRANADDYRLNGVLAADSLVQTTAIGIYAEANYQLTDALKIIGGLRYSTEEKHFTASRGGPTLVDEKADWSAVTPRISAIYSLSDVANIYATYSQGFKSGAFNSTTISPTNNRPVNPEFLDAYEVGYKFARSGLSFNTSAFYYQYDDIQVASISTQGQTVVSNAATAKSYGADAELIASLNDHWNIRLGAAYTHASYTDYKNAPLSLPLPGGGNANVVGDATGNRLFRSPDFTANASATYRTPLAGGELAATGAVYYNSGFFWAPTNRLKQPAYTTLNGRVSWEPANAAWKVSVWGNNLTDKTYQMYGAESTYGDGVAYARPRSIGVTLDLRFN